MFNRKLITISCIALITLLAGCVNISKEKPESARMDKSNSFRNGQIAFKLRQYSKAYELWMPLARAGCPIPQRTIAHIYLTGKGVEKNNEKAVKWLQKSSRTGASPEASFVLGGMYLLGNHVNKDITKSVEYFKLAAKRGDINARAALSIMWLNGRIKHATYSEKISWLSGAIVEYKKSGDKVKANRAERALLNLMSHKLLRNNYKKI